MTEGKPDIERTPEEWMAYNLGQLPEQIEAAQAAAETRATSPAVRPNGRRLIGGGTALLAVGVVGAVVALLLPNTIETPHYIELTSIGDRIQSGTDQTYNLPRAQLQSLILQASCAASIVGAVLLSAGHIVRALFFAPERTVATAEIEA